MFCDWLIRKQSEWNVVLLKAACEWGEHRTREQAAKETSSCMDIIILPNLMKVEGGHNFCVRLLLNWRVISILLCVQRGRREGVQFSKIFAYKRHAC